MNKYRLSQFTESDIIHENGDFWVLRVGTGHYEILRSGITHSVRCGTVHYSQDPARAERKAIEDCDSRSERRELSSL